MIVECKGRCQKPPEGGVPRFQGGVQSIFMIFRGGIYHSWYFQGGYRPFSKFLGGVKVFSLTLGRVLKRLKKRSQNRSKLGQKPSFFRGGQPNFQKILGGVKNLCIIFRGGLEHYDLFQGGYIYFTQILGGVRASRPSAAILRYPPPLDVFDTFPQLCSYS